MKVVDKIVAGIKEHASDYADGFISESQLRFCVGKDVRKLIHSFLKLPMKVKKVQP